VDGTDSEECGYGLPVLADLWDRTIRGLIRMINPKIFYFFKISLTVYKLLHS
jgi:hypothetical protein